MPACALCQAGLEQPNSSGCRRRIAHGRLWRTRCGVPDHRRRTPAGICRRKTKFSRFDAQGTGFAASHRLLDIDPGSGRPHLRVGTRGCCARLRQSPFRSPPLRSCGGSSCPPGRLPPSAGGVLLPFRPAGCRRNVLSPPSRRLPIVRPTQTEEIPLRSQLARRARLLFRPAALLGPARPVRLRLVSFCVRHA